MIYLHINVSTIVAYSVHWAFRLMAETRNEKFGSRPWQCTSVCEYDGVIAQSHALERSARTAHDVSFPKIKITPTSDNVHEFKYFCFLLSTSWSLFPHYFWLVETKYCMKKHLQDPSTMQMALMLNYSMPGLLQICTLQNAMMSHIKALLLYLDEWMQNRFSQ